MPFLRHVGKHGDRKVAVVFRQVPGEEHMCLVVYTELLNRHIHDPLIQCIESDIGQNSESLADALNRSYTQDGRPILGTLHKEGFLKKVQTEQVLMTPQPGTQIKLNELNTMLDEMKKGEEAIRKLKDMDDSRGLQHPADVARRMRADKQQTNTRGVTAQTAGALGDADLANNLRQQAQRMATEARGLLAESDRLLKEAAQMDGTALQPVVEPTATKKGRPKKDKGESEAVTMEAILQSVAATPPAKKTRTRNTRVAKGENI